MKIGRFSKVAAVIWLLWLGGTSVASASQPSDADATALSEQFAESIRNRQQDSAVAMIDAKTLISRAQAGINAPALTASTFRELAGDSFSISLVRSFIQKVSHGSTCKFMRVRKRADGTVAVFRMLAANGSVDYSDFYVEDDPQGQPHFVDMYDIAKGELSSQTIRRLYLAAVISTDKTVATGLGNRERQFVDGMPALTRMMSAVSVNDWRGALDAYQQLSPSMQQEKIALCDRVLAADQLIRTDPAEYTAAIEAFQKAYPNDPALDLLQLDHLFLDRQYAAANQAVGRLMAFTGEDGHWDYLLGNLQMLAAEDGDFSSAIAAYQKGIDIEPDLADPYFGLLRVYLRQKDHASTATMLTTIQKKLHRRFGDLTRLAAYQDFVKSDEYRQWLRSQRRHAASTKPA